MRLHHLLIHTILFHYFTNHLFQLKTSPVLADNLFIDVLQFLELLRNRIRNANVEFLSSGAHYKRFLAEQKLNLTRLISLTCSDTTLKSYFARQRNVSHETSRLKENKQAYDVGNARAERKEISFGVVRNLEGTVLIVELLLDFFILFFSL